MTNGTPIHLAAPSTPPYPDHYVVYVTQIHCSCCSRFTFNQEVYAITFLKSVLGEGKRIKNARPVVWPSRASDALFNLPIRTELLPSKTIPFCFQCNEPSLIAWPSVPLLEPTAVSGSRNITAVAPPAPGHVARTTPSSKTPAAASKPSKAKSIDDILSMI